MKSHTVFMLPKRMKKDLSIEAIKSGFGNRGKSLWVEKAITQFLKLDNYIDIVSETSDMTGLDSREAVVIDNIVMGNLNAAVNKITEMFPRMNGVKSTTIRAAVIQGIVRGVNK